MRQANLIAIILLLSVVTIQDSFSQLKSFPGAEGAGAYTSGGRGSLATPTTVFEVTNLTDVNTAGSLRYACSQSTTTYPNRTIVFRVSGTIHLNSRLTIQKNTTIAGQTAPGDGICIADYPVVISGDNVIVRYLRFRLGDKNQLKTTPANCGVPVAPFTPACMPVNGSGGDDAFGNTGNKNIIIDHCSVSWSTDEALTVYQGDSVTMQWNFIMEPLNYSYHFETGDADFEHHGFGGIWGSRHGSFHHNLFAHCVSRNPRFGGNSTYNGDTESSDFRNNVIYNWGLYTVYGGEGGEYNLVNNYYKYGPSTGSGTRYRIVNVDSTYPYPFARYYLSGNYVDGSVTNTNNNWSGALMSSGIAADTVLSKVTVPFLSPYLPSNTQTATEAYDSVLAGAGAILPRRDTLDRRIVNDVRFRGGKHIDVQGGFTHGTPYAQTTDAWPSLASTTAPADTDHDGMTDMWENANGLNPNNAADRQTVASNGYTNLENYLNGITNTSPEIYFTGLLNNFSQTSGSPSAVQTLILSGVNLSGNVTLTPPDGYEISINGGTNWFTNVNPIVLTPASGILPNTTLSIRMKTAILGTYIGNIVATTPGVGNFYFKLIGLRTGSNNTSGPASATWLLLNNENATVTGNITATPQVLGSAISGIAYNNTFGGVSGWQRTATDAAGSLPIGYSPNAYLQYTLTPTGDNTFTASLISMGALGGGTGTARMAVYYSLDGFTTSVPAGDCTYNGTTSPATTASPVSLLNTSTTPLTGQQIATIPVNIIVPPTQTLSLRVFVWITGTGNRYFASQNVKIDGVTSDATVPLYLISFSAGASGSTNKLYWVTVNETNMQFFEIEKSSDGSEFKSIGKVNANNRASNNYHFIDNATNGTGYYRLKMVNKDGSYSYSLIVIVKRLAKAILSVYPNPVNDVITVTYPSAGENPRLEILSIQGKTIQSLQLPEGSTQTSFNLNFLQAGIYLLKYTNGKELQTIKLIKH